MCDAVSIQVGTFQARVYLPMINELPTANIRKLFRLVLRYDRENEAAIQTIALYLQNAVEDSLHAWKARSQECLDGYVDIKGLQLKRKRKDKLKIAQENNRLTKAARSAKALYNQWLKIQALWNDTKHQMNVK